MADGQTSPSGGEIQVAREAGVTRLTISSPGKKNALSKAMYLAMRAALQAAAGDDEVRVVVLQGADGVFTSGNDVADFGGPVAGGKPPSIQFLETIATFPKPIVAQVEGLAIGIGSTMLLHCDLIYAAEGTRFQLPFVNLGLVPEAASSYLLPRLMGAARASELLMLGEMFPASVAREAGLVSQVLPAEELADHVRARAATLAAKPPEALRRTKALVRSLPAGIVLGRIAEESEIFSACVAGPEFAEALAAFQAKRPPDFSKL